MTSVRLWGFLIGWAALGCVAAAPPAPSATPQAASALRSGPGYRKVAALWAAWPEGEIPAGYREWERDGLRFFLRDGEERVVEALLPVIHELRRSTDDRLEVLAARVVEDMGDVGTGADVLADLAQRERIFESLCRHMELDPQESAKARKLWDLNVNVAREAFIKRYLALYFCRALSLDNFQVVTADELVAGAHPFVCYQRKLGRPTLQLHAGWSSKEGRYIATVKGERRGPTRRLITLPLFEGALPDGCDAAWWLKHLAEVALPDVLEWAPGGKDPGPAFFTEEGSAFFALHETAEITLFQKFNMRDPLARWFHDGMANYLAHEVVREIYSEDAWAKTLYDPRDREAYAEEREGVNLLAWARADIEDLWPQSHSDAHYHFATQEIRRIADLYGREAWPQIMRKFREYESVTTEVICSVVQRATGEDLAARLQAYLPPTPQGSSVPKLMKQIERHLAKQEGEAAAALLRAVAAHAPRETEARLALVHLLLTIDAERYLDEFLYHARILHDFQIIRQETYKFTMSGDAPTPAQAYALGRFMQLGRDHPEALRWYRQASSQDPEYRDVQTRIAELEAEADKVREE